MTVLESLVLIRDDYLAALAADAAAGAKASYSLDGQAVDRNTWRTGLIKVIGEINELLQIAQPYELRGNGI